MNFDNTLIRCSSLGYIFTEPQSKAAKEAGELSATAKQHLIEIYVREKFGREKEITTKYMEKGLQVEEDSITLYSRLKKAFFKKNEERITNLFIAGTPDLYVGESVYAAKEIIDIKSSWDLFTFFRNHTEPINKNYYYQLQGYMYLTGAETAKLAYCLIDTPETLILDEERRLLYKMNAGTTENTEYLQACEALRAAMTFGDIPLEQKLIEFEVQRDDEVIEKIGQKVQRCREYLNDLESRIDPDVIVAEYEENLKVTIVD